MKSNGLSSMLRRVSVLATATLAVLGVHTAAFAQQSRTPNAPLVARRPKRLRPPLRRRRRRLRPRPRRRLRPCPRRHHPATARRQATARHQATPRNQVRPAAGYSPPPGYAPQPSYGPRYRSATIPATTRHPTPVPMRSTYRPFMLSLGLGLSSLSSATRIARVTSPGMSYAVHMGFGITRAGWSCWPPMEPGPSSPVPASTDIQATHSRRTPLGRNSSSSPGCIRG